jgi:hypothetical protein
MAFALSKHSSYSSGVDKAVMALPTEKDTYFLDCIKHLMTTLKSKSPFGVNNPLLRCIVLFSFFQVVNNFHSRNFGAPVILPIG